MAGERPPPAPKSPDATSSKGTGMRAPHGVVGVEDKALGAAMDGRRGTGDTGWRGVTLSRRRRVGGTGFRNG